MAQYLDEIDKKYWMMVHPYDTIGNVGPSDISVCCPICHEGKSWLRKHRLHLYVKPDYDNAAVKCFNCEYSTNLYGYLKENHTNEFSLYVNEKRGSGLKTLKSLFKKEENNKDDSKIDISTGLDFSKKEESNKDTELDDCKEAHEEKAMSKDEINAFSCGLDFGNPVASTSKKEKYPIEDDTGLKLIKPLPYFSDIPEDAKNYLNQRGLTPQKDWKYSPKGNEIIFNGAKQVLSEYIIIPLTKDGLWYGFQALAWKQKRFFVYMVTGNSGFKVWNFYNIDKSKPVYVFESIYDALSSGLDNVIAQLGANLSEDRLAELKEPIFCLDNQRVDQKSHEETTKYLERGFSCFIWPEGSEKFKDTNDLRKLNVPYEKISKMILNNIHKGMIGILKLKMIRV